MTSRTVALFLISFYVAALSQNGSQADSITLNPLQMRRFSNNRPVTIKGPMTPFQLGARQKACVQGLYFNLTFLQSLPKRPFSLPI